MNVFRLKSCWNYAFPFESIFKWYSFVCAKLKKIFALLKVEFLFIVALVFISNQTFSQTYTTSGLSSNWNDPAAWVKTNPDGCATQNTANVPPLGPVNDPNCQIRIIINHPINRTGDTNIGGGFLTSLTVNQGGEVNFSGNVTVNNSGGNVFNFQINDGGRFIVSGTLGIRAGAIFNVVNTSNLEPKTFIQVNNLTFLNAGSGQSVNVGPNTIFNVLNQTRLEGGGALNIQGNFNTNTFNSANSGGNQVNISGNGLLQSSGNMQIDGYPMNLTGNASVLVGGNLTISNSGSSALNLNGPNTNFTVLTRGSVIANGKNPSGSCFQTPENGNNCFNPGCLEVLVIPSANSNTFERVYIFKCSYNWTTPNNTEDEEIVDQAEILIVAGGGGGGRGSSAGGGGAGGLIHLPSISLTPGNVVPVIVGMGGNGAPTTNPIIQGINGTNSEFLGNVASGGGGGGSNGSGLINGRPGGSGGGGANSGGSGGSNQAGQGNRGGEANNSGGGNTSGAGGGGAGGAAPNVANGNGNPGGPGGAGSPQSISGGLIVYSAGGGGTGQGSAGSGGSGVGGNGNNTGIGFPGISPGSGGGAGSTGGGNGANGIVIVRQTFRILPVEFLHFNGSYDNIHRSIKLEWATGKEWENSHFEVERAINQVKEFNIVGEVEGVGFSDAPVFYNFQDDFLPLSGGMAYYRLRQVDFDGTFAYSYVIGVRFQSLESSGNTWKAYPNPTDGQNFTLDLLNRNNYQDELISIKLISTTGKQLIFTGNSINQLNGQIQKVLREATNGVFVLEIRWGNQVEHHKILKK